MGAVTIGLLALTGVVVVAFAYALYDYRRICTRSNLRPFPPSTKEQRGAARSAASGALTHGGKP